jgi:Cell division protein FtsI/penicillin-binding protein 2
MTKKRLFRVFKVQNFWIRQGFIKYLFVFLFLGFAFRIISINQLNAGEISLQEKGVKQTISKLKETARRGDILDRNNEVLASSLILKKVNLDSTKVQLEYIPMLADALNMPSKRLREILAKKRKIGSRHLIIKKNLLLTDPIISNIRKLQKERIKSLQN